MKNKLLLIIFVLLSANPAFSQDFKGIKILINPGHGGHDPANDRYIPATGFWESDGNLDKGLYLRDIMKSLGAEIVMSRVTNTDADDLPLSQIVAMANNNNVHFMQSIHSNAAGSTNYANYTLMLYQGWDLSPTYPESRPMAQYIGAEIYGAHRTAYLAINGDFNFYGTGKPYLGVFKGLNMPATLSEGSFHDYVPESWRLMSTAYRKHEAWAIARGFVKFWGKEPFNHGIIAGIVRDPDAKVSYTWINAHPNDAFKPVNNVKVTLQPGNRVFNADNYNNGFFMFDSVTPGQYKLYFEAQGYLQDSATANVEANKNAFADMFLQVYSPTAPRITSFTPGAQVDSVKAIDPIKINFNVPIMKSVFEKLFDISPKAEVSFLWENNNRTVSIKPVVPFEKATKYTVTIPKDVKSVSSIISDTVYTYSFTTKNRNRLNIISIFPKDGQNDVAQVPQMRIKFDVPLLGSSLKGNVNLYGPNGEKINIANTKVLSVENRGIIYFEPQLPMETNKNYRFELGAGISDANGYNLVDTVKINFRTYYEKYISGNIIDSLETAGGWKNPSFSGSTTGVDTSISRFEISADKEVSGNNSGKVTYKFTGDSLGVCRVYNSLKPGVGKATDFGMWIYGDLSFNRLEFWFYYNGTTNAIISADTLNWAGWKFKKVSLSSISTTGDKLFHSLVIRQNKEGQDSSIIYFDDPQYNIVTPVEENGIRTVPGQFALAQNYPNPFNPATIISYSLPENSYVTLKIYDMLGREVASLINEQQNAGSYKVNFNASRLTSGIYIYKLNAGKFTESRKMTLVK